VASGGYISMFSGMQV